MAGLEEWVTVFTVAQSFDRLDIFYRLFMLHSVFLWQSFTRFVALLYVHRYSVCVQRSTFSAQNQVACVVNVIVSYVRHILAY